MPESPNPCPVCDAFVPAKAPCCPDCGADHETGWSEAASTQHLDLPGEDFDYDEFVKSEFGDGSPTSQLRPNGIPLIWWLTALILILAFFCFFLF